MSDEAEGAALRKISKEIEAEKHRIGKECEIRLTVRSKAFELNFFHSEDWWIDHLLRTSKAIEELDDVYEKQKAAQDAAEYSQREKVLQDLRDLIRDDSFAKMPTQRAMVAYAVDAVDDLEEFLDEDEIKAEVQKLNDRLIARGLRKA